MTRSISTANILNRLRAAGTRANVEGLARYGIRPAKAFGVSTPATRALAKELRRNPELAPALWSTGVLEARMLATMIADPLNIPEQEIERWASDFDCWSVCDSACICLLWKTPFAWRKVREWSRREPEYERRAAFALLAGLAVHDKQAPDQKFLATFRLIRTAATDERNFVKKAVNWALRQIGKRDANLRDAAIQLAAELAASESRSARWIGHDALRELRAKQPKWFFGYTVCIMSLDRRSFLNQSAVALAGTALSYSRVYGANERISLGHIGVGSRGTELAGIAALIKDKHNVEMTAVCDLWKVNRERAAAKANTAYGRPPRALQYFEDLIALKDVDAVLISTPDFTHSPILKMVVEAGKDAYCEKPMGNVLEEAKAARDAVLASKRIVQVGTQHRSEPYQIAARDLIRTGALGQVTKYEIEWNYHGPRWRGRPEVKQLREEDTDWRRWLMTKPYRPFDPQLYFEFRLYKEFSSGIPDQWMTHGIDLTHFFLDDHFPRSVTAHGGIFAWPDGRENPDTFHTLLEYPKGFLVSYSTSFGNDSDSFTRIMGKKATLINIGGEGSQRWKLVEEKGNHEDYPMIKRAESFVTVPGKPGPGLPFISDNDTSHMANWFECLRSRQQPNATVRHGFAHSVAVIMAARSYREGKKLYWNQSTETISDAVTEPRA